MIDDPELPKAGLTPLSATETRWTVWAPKARRVALVLGSGGETREIAMEPAGRGFHGCVTDPPASGTRYAYRLDGGDPWPDPCSRWQPEGIHAPSAVWDPDGFSWDERGWAGIARRDLVFSEVHIGTFTPEGTFDAVIPRVDALRELGITAIELMPVGQFPGSRGWGYDGVHPFAPQHCYGGPDGLQRLVQACHRKGMAVFLDVVYNHFGPEGNYFPRFGDYLTDKYRTDWGPALNFDGRNCDPVRALILENARQWIRDFRFDGLRLDAADQIYDRSPRHILSEIAEVVHDAGTRLGRPVHVFAETDLNDAPRFLQRLDRGGYGLDGHWNDDFHHAAHATLSGESGGYYADFHPAPEALAKAFAKVFVNDGSYSGFRGRRHGTGAADLSGDRFVAFTQNHDQVGNRLKSDRNAAMLPPSAVRLAAGLLLLAPRLPLLFMGEEYGESNPFPYFCDFHDPDLVRAVREGRKAEFSYFGWEAEVPDPVAPSTRDVAVLSWSWSDPFRAGLRRLYGDLLRLRRETPALRDFSRVGVRLRESPSGARILEVTRGEGPSDPLCSTRAVFNLGGEESPLEGSDAPGAPWFRSEASAYGGASTGVEAWDRRLLPHEFVLFGPR